MEPVVVYTRRLKTAHTGAPAASVSGENAPAFFSEAAQRPYTDELVRDNLCAFVSGQAAEVDQVEVTVMSILQFVPGMRIAIATEADGVDIFERYVYGSGFIRYVDLMVCVGSPSIDLERAGLHRLQGFHEFLSAVSKINSGKASTKP